jgi:hypothetical protein
MTVPYDYRTIEKMDRADLTHGFRAALSIAPPEIILHGEAQNAYYHAKKNDFLGLTTARLLVEEQVSQDSLDLFQEKIAYKNKLVIIPIHGLDIDQNDLDHPRASEHSQNFIPYALGQYFAEKTGHDFHPYFLRPTNKIKRTGLKGDGIFVAHSLFDVDDEHIGALKGRRVVLFDNTINGGSSAMAAASVIKKKLGARSICGLVSLTQYAAPQSEEEYNKIWDFLPTEETKKKFAAKINFAENTGLFEKTYGYDPMLMTQREMTGFMKSMNEKKKQLNLGNHSVDAVVKDHILMRQSWADTHHPETKIRPAHQKKNNLSYVHS